MSGRGAVQRLAAHRRRRVQQAGQLDAPSAAWPAGRGSACPGAGCWPRAPAWARAPPPPTPRAGAARPRCGGRRWPARRGPSPSSCSCSPRWCVHRRVGRAPGRAGQRHRRGPHALAAHEQLGRGGQERALAARRRRTRSSPRTPPAAPRAARRRRRARRRGPGPRGRARPSRGRRRGCARPRAPPPTRSAREARPRRCGGGPPGRVEQRQRRGAQLARPPLQPRHQVVGDRRRAGRPLRRSGARRRRCGPAPPRARSGARAGSPPSAALAPPSSANAKPPTATSPDPGGPSVVAPTAAPASSRQRAATAPKRSPPVPSSRSSAALPSAATALPSREGCSKQNQRSPGRREATTVAGRVDVGADADGVGREHGRRPRGGHAARPRRPAGGERRDGWREGLRPEGRSSRLAAPPGDGDLARARHLDQAERAHHAARTPRSSRSCR